MWFTLDGDAVWVCLTLGTLRVYYVLTLLFDGAGRSETVEAVQIQRSAVPGDILNRFDRALARDAL